MTATSLGATLANCSDPTVLVPGSAGALRGDADQLDQQSRALAEQAADLRAAHPTTWAGDAADGWAGRREQLAQTLEAVSEVHSTAGAALLLHAQTLEWGQWDPDNPDVVSVWSVASAAYAEQANGVVRAVIGQDLRPGNVWESAELPVLRSSPDVTQVVRIDPLTGEEVVIYP
jgi:uncharacterized protein YukE